MKRMNAVERWMRHNILNSGMYNNGARDMECPYCYSEVPVYPKDNYGSSTGCIKCDNSIKYVKGVAMLDTSETRDMIISRYLDDRAPKCRLCGQRHFYEMPAPTSHYPSRFWWGMFIQGDGKTPMRYDSVSKQWRAVTKEDDIADGWIINDINSQYMNIIAQMQDLIVAEL